jgi:hypothetical protein
MWLNFVADNVYEFNNDDDVDFGEFADDDGPAKARTTKRSQTVIYNFSLKFVWPLKKYFFENNKNFRHLRLLCAPTAATQLPKSTCFQGKMA